MLLPGDLLKLHVQSEAEKFLKPWWDVVVDYLIVILVMVAVVCGVVGLAAPGPVCIPVLPCPAQDSSLDKIATCAAVIHNSTRKGENSFDIAVQFITNRNMFDYVNSECSEDIFWMVRFFPNILIIIVGSSLVCNNAWFVLLSPMLEQLSDLLHQCYKHADTVNNQTSHDPNRASTSQGRTTLCRHCLSQHATPAACETAEERDRVKRKLKKYVQDFEENYNTNSPCCPNFCSIKNSYIMISVVQAAVAIVSFIILVWLMDKKMNRQYECNNDEKVSGLVYDHFVCSYSIIKFYLLGKGFFTTITLIHTAFSSYKLVSLKRLLKTDRFDKVSSLNIESPDLKFLLNLVELSNPAYLNTFCEMYEDE